MKPELTVVLNSYPESNGKRNWTSMFKRTTPFDGLVGNCGGVTIDRGEYWNRVAYHGERARVLLGERETEPDIMEYGVDVKTPEEWEGVDPEGVFAIAVSVTNSGKRTVRKINENSDLRHNMDLNRLIDTTPKDFERANKYMQFYKELESLL